MFKEKTIKIGVAHPAFFHSIKESFSKDEVTIVDKNENYVKNYDLIVFTGGEDINPAYYNQRPTFTSHWNDARDDLEIGILREIYGSKVKILAICRGFQLFSAYIGGRLIQDIILCGKQPHGGWHTLSLQFNNSMINGFSKVNSMHHQGVDSVPSNKVKITSTFGGLIESIENNQTVGVQFHPELMGNSESKEFFEKIRDWSLNKTSVPEIKKSKLKYEEQDWGTISPTTTTTTAINFHAPLPDESYDQYTERMYNLRGAELKYQNGDRVYNIPRPVAHVEANILEQENRIPDWLRPENNIVNENNDILPDEVDVQVWDDDIIEEEEN